MNFCQQKTAVFLFTALLSASSFVGCAPYTQKQIAGSGVKTSKVVPVANFQKIEVNNIGNVVLSQGNTESLTIEADNNLLEYIETAVLDNALRIKIKNDVQVTTKTPLRYLITIKNIQSIGLSGAVKLDAESITGESLSVQTSGSTDFQATVNVKQLTVHSSGNSELTVNGSAEKQKLLFSGATKYNAKSLVSNAVSIDAHGSTTATVSVKDELKGALSGSSHVGYFGSPKVIVSTSGSSSIKKI